MNEWISVKDRLPKLDTPIIICDNCESKIGIFDQTFNGKFEFYTTNYQDYVETKNVTHWMYLPNPPSFIEENK